MSSIKIPKGYHSELNLHDTQVAIKTVKDCFQTQLSARLDLHRVSAPLFVAPETGLNDNLNGVERPVEFSIKEQAERKAEVVQSLAKWKRYALDKYGFSVGEGLYTDMNAIRRDEETDNTHSIFVDQWDWEMIINKEDRNLYFLKEVVRDVYSALRKTEKFMAIQYDYIEEILPHDIFFITSQELEDMMEERKNFYAEQGKPGYMAVEGVDRRAIATMPILTSGDVTGAVAFMESEKCKSVTELQKSLISASAQFLGKQLEA